MVETGWESGSIKISLIQGLFKLVQKSRWCHHLDLGFLTRQA